MAVPRAFSIQCLYRLRHLGDGIGNKTHSSLFSTAKKSVYKAFFRESSSHETNIIHSDYGDVEIPDVTFNEYLFKRIDKYAKRVCVINGDTDESFTYEEIFDKSTRLASALSRLGVGKGDLVAIVSPNCPEFLLSFTALAHIGAVSTTINTSYTEDEILKQLQDCTPSVVITHSLLLNKVGGALRRTPFVRHTILIDGEADNDVTIPMQRLLKDDGKGIPILHINPSEDILTMPYSSGTTGLPKGVMLTHTNVIANLQQYLHPGFNRLDPLSDKMEVFIGILPMFHIYGMNAIMSLSACVGGKVITLRSFEPSQFLQILEKHKPTVLNTVPPLLAFLTASSGASPNLLSAVHSVTCGAAPVGPSLVEAFLKKFGESIDFQEGYGMTEASPLTHLTPRSKFVVGSCGTAIPNTMTKLVDVETGEIVNPKESTGELCVKGPQVMKGYFKNEEATRETLTEDGWLHTGDIARIDEDKNVFIVDRKKELIKVKGLQVAPAEIEDLLRKHPQIQDVAVVGVTDERSGEVPRAFVVVSNECHVQAKDIEAFVAKRMASHKRLAGGVIFVDRIPKSDTGKILRRMLK